MKKIFKKITISILVFAGIILILNIPVKTRQGVDGALFIKKLPLYVKTCGFLCRNYQYGALAASITKGIKNDRDKILAIYTWTVENIQPTPKSLPVVDDHIWNIIIRRYGGIDQTADVFTTLAYYAGYEAFFEALCINEDKKLVLSFVRTGNEWHIFDVFNKRPFIAEGDLAIATPYGPTYNEYLKTMDMALFESRIRRPGKQAPLSRAIYEIKEFFKKSG